MELFENIWEKAGYLESTLNEDIDSFEGRYDVDYLKSNTPEDKMSSKEVPEQLFEHIYKFTHL
jgi:hypothetical protein